MVPTPRALKHTHTHTQPNESNVQTVTLNKTTFPGSKRGGGAWGQKHGGCVGAPRVRRFVLFIDPYGILIKLEASTT